jgi:hypothetical protein
MEGKVPITQKIRKEEETCQKMKRSGRKAHTNTWKLHIIGWKLT